MAENITNFVKEYRLQQQLTQQELANMLDVSRQSINAIERGRYVPSLTLAIKCARIFNCPVETIFILEEKDR